jgi:hypothetical protein
LPVNIQNLTVEIYRNGSSTFDEIIVGALILTLAFLGIGRGANRGFGRFVPNTCPNIANSICNKILQGDVRGAFDEFYNVFRRVTNCNRMNSWTQSAVPLAPLAQLNNTDSILIIPCKADKCEQLDVIQNAVMKVTFKTTVFQAKNTDEGGYIHTFIYGLPRHSVVVFKTDVNGYTLQTDPQNLHGIIRKYFRLDKDIRTDENTQQPFKPLKGITGYYALRGNNIVDIRRQSMYILSPFKDKIIILPFLSLIDHENEINNLVHIGVHKKGDIATQLNVVVRPVRDLINGNRLTKHERQLALNNPKLAFGNLRELIENYTNILQRMIRCR